MNNLNIKQIFKVFLEYKLYFLGPLITSTALALIYALIATPIYRADVLLTSAGEEGNALGQLANQYSSLARVAGISLPGSSEDKSATHLAILTSRQFIEQHVSDRNIRPALFENMWDKDEKKWVNGEPSALQTYKYMRENIMTLDIDRRTGLISFAILWKDPKVAAQWANNMIEDLNSHIRKQAVEETQKNIFFLEEQLEKTTQVNAITVMYSLIEEQTKNIMLANVREEYAFKVIDPAVAPEMRVKPKRTNILIIGFILGCIFGSFSVLIKNYLEPQTSN